MTECRTSERTAESRAGDQRKPYVAPALVEHGTVEKLTATFGHAGSDSIGGVRGGGGAGSG